MLHRLAFRLSVKAVFPTEVPLPFYLELTSTCQKINQDYQPGPKLYPLESDEVWHPANGLDEFVE